MRWVAPAVAIAAIAFACTSFGDGPDEPNANDGGTSSSSGSSGASDDGSSDGPSPTDASGNVGNGFCTRPENLATACVDFEDGVVAPNGWTPYENGKATAQVVETCGPGDSVRCVELSGSYPLDAGADPGDFGAALRFATTGAPRSATLSMAVRVGEITGGSTDLLGIVMTGGGADFWVLEVEVNADGTMRLAEHAFKTGLDSPTYQPAGTLPFASWKRLDLALQVTTDTSIATLRVDGKIVAQKALVAHALSAFEWVEIGDRQLDFPVSSKIRFDEIVVQISP